MSKASPPLTRVRGKSTPRAKSPDPRSLKKAAKALVTPPPKGSNKSERKSSSSSGKKAQDAQRKLSFGKNSETAIVAENPPGDCKPSASAAAKADQIFRELQEPKEGLGDYGRYRCFNEFKDPKGFGGL